MGCVALQQTLRGLGFFFPPGMLCFPQPECCVSHSLKCCVSHSLECCVSHSLECYVSHSLSRCVFFGLELDVVSLGQEKRRPQG